MQGGNGFHTDGVLMVDRFQIILIFGQLIAKTMLRSLLIVLLACISSSYNAQVSILWSQTYTSTGNNIDRAIEMVMDGAGNVYVTGIGRGSSGNFDIVTIKYSAAGVQQWISSYNGTGNSLDEARGIAIDAAGNVYVVGWTNSTGNNYNYVTIKYNGISGGQVWAQLYNGTGNATDDPYDIKTDASANVFVTGGVTTANGEDFGTVKYDSTGAQQWVQVYSFTGVNIDKAQALAVDNGGFVYVTGFSIGTGTGLDYATLKYNNAGVLQWAGAHRYNGTGNNDDQSTSIAVDNGTGNIYVTGTSRNVGIVDFDYATVMINSAGTQQWVMRYAGTAMEIDQANDVVVDVTGNCFVTGKVKNSSSNEDNVTIKYSIAGAELWVRTVNAAANNFDEGASLALNAAANYLYVGGTSNNGTNVNDFFTMKLRTSDGGVEWSTRFNGTANGSDIGFDIALDAMENVHVTGQTTGTGSGQNYLTIKYCQLLTTVSPDTSVCLNGSVQLTSSAPGATAYSWTPATGLNSTTIANPIANPTTTTSYIVTITNANGCTDSDTITVTVYPLPGPSITPSGPTTFCVGGSVTLTGPANFIYSWMPGGATTQSIIANTSNTYTLVITDTNTCAAQSTLAVVVNPLPNVNAGPNDTVCLSQTAQLQATGASSYSWTPVSTLSNPAIANPVAGPTTTTTYYVVGTDGNSCSASDSVRITVMPNPPVPTINWSGWPNNILTCNQGGYSYQWYTMSPATAIPGATNQTYMPLQSDTFFVMIIDQYGCSTSSITIILGDVGITEFYDPFNSTLFPNPNDGNFTLNCNLGSQHDVNFDVMDLSGKVIWTREMKNAFGEISLEISLQEISEGMYFLRIHSESGSISRKFLVK